MSAVDRSRCLRLASGMGDMSGTRKKADKFRSFRIARLLALLTWVLGVMFLTEHLSALSCVSFAVFVVVVLYTTYWPCPSCGRPFCTIFTLRRAGNWPFRNTCVHCKKSMAEINTEGRPPDSSR